MNHLDNISENEMEKKFNELSLEYKINHISRAKKFARFLHEIGCFYTDKPTDMEVVTKFSDEELAVIGPLEHERWCWEHYVMGWKYDDSYKAKSADKAAIQRIREMTKTHCNMPTPDLMPNGEYRKNEVIEHFVRLSKEDQIKDVNPMNNLLKVLLHEDGIKIYRFR